MQNRCNCSQPASSARTTGRTQNTTCSCNQPAARQAVIRDYASNNCFTQDIYILSTRIFDGVQQRMESIPCVINIESEFVPFSIINAYTTEQRAWAEDVFISDYNDTYQFVECNIIGSGRAIFTDSQGAEHSAYCTINIPYSALMIFPDDALLPAFLTCLCNASISSSNPAAKISDSSFSTYCNGAYAVFTSANIPIKIGSNGPFYPDDISRRSLTVSQPSANMPVFTNTDIYNGNTINRSTNNGVNTGSDLKCGCSN